MSPMVVHPPFQTQLTMTVYKRMSCTVETENSLAHLAERCSGAVRHQRSGSSTHSARSDLAVVSRAITASAR
jgi:hypothetical protein